MYPFRSDGDDMKYDMIVKRWEAFLREAGVGTYITSTFGTTDKQSVVVSHRDINLHDPELADHLLENPTSVIRGAERAANAFIPPDEIELLKARGLKPELNVRIKEIPMTDRIEVRSIRAAHLNRYIAVKGLIKNTVQVRPRLHIAVYECLKCTEKVRVIQERMVQKEPLQCPGCRKDQSLAFRLLTDESVFIDTQKLEIQESPEGLKGGEQPQRLTAYLEKDLTGQVFPGNKVILNGTVRATPSRASRVQSTTYNIYLDVNSIEIEEHDFEDYELTAEDEEEIILLAKDSNIYDKVASSIAPTIYGMELEKNVLALQLFGGVMKTAPDNTKIRGDIHILLVGDPGTAKSQLLRYISRMAPRGIYASGQAATRAGLTAAAVPDDTGEGRWTLEAGALVLADKGMACIDEIDKMRSEDRSSMHEAMAQQTVSVAKAGITATLQARCSLLAAANPQHGRFDKFKTIIEQINLPPPLITRFDVIFSLMDKPDAEKDGELASHILKTSMVAEQMQHDRAKGSHIEPIADETIVPAIDHELLKKYVSYARRNVFPVLTQSAAERLNEYFVDMRRVYSIEGTVAITARQLEALIRLSEASARLRLSEKIVLDDVERSIHIMENFLHTVALSEDGSYDIDMYATGTGISKTKRDRLTNVLQIIRNAGAEGITRDDLRNETAPLDINEEELEYILNQLREEYSNVYIDQTGRIKSTR